MFKHIILAFSLCTSLNGMEAPQSPCWDDGYHNKMCAVSTIAHLHILQNSNLNTKNLIILDATCRKGHTSNFLARNAKIVYGYDADKTLFYNAQKQSSHNLIFTKEINQENFYDLIVAFAPSTSIDLLRHLRTLLVSNGEMLCTFITQSNPLPIAAAAYQEILPTIHNVISKNGQAKYLINGDTENKEYPSDETLQNMINKTQFTILSYEQKIFDITILNKDKFRDFHTSGIMDWPFIQHINDQKKRENIARQCIDMLLSKIKKDNADNWFYPINTTVIHLRKTD